MQYTYPWLHMLLRTIPVDARALLDVGCGRGVVGALATIYRDTFTVGVDIFQPYLQVAKRFFDVVLQGDAQTSLPFRDGSFDVATCIEVIEHLPKSAGERLLDELERVARRIIVTTPNYWFKQRAFDKNKFQLHKSVWSAGDFRKRGYRVRGLGEFFFRGRYVRYLSFFLSPVAYVLTSFAGTLFVCSSSRYPLPDSPSPNKAP